MVKEQYFTAQTLDHQARQMLSEVQDLRKGHSLRLDFKHAALLVLDMQRYFLEESSHAYIPSATAIIPKVKELIAAFSRKNLPIIFTRHLNTPENAGQMAHWWRDLITPEHPLSVITPQLETKVGMVLEKSQYDAFYRTSLEEILRERGVRQVVICGVMTHLCCETTARSAFMRGFEAFFTIDGTATYNERFHRATLFNLAHGFACPVLVSELLAALAEEDKVGVAIIGAGPAGIAAALQLRRSGIEPLLLERAELGGLLRNAHLVENYPGFPQGIRGEELVRLFVEQLKNIGVAACFEEVRALDYNGRSFIIETEKRKITAKIVVLASGTKPRGFTDCPIPKEAQERIFYEVHPLRAMKRGRIAIIGAGDAAFDYALQLAAHENEVFIINHGDQIKALASLQERAMATPSISYKGETKIVRITNAENGILLHCSSSKKRWRLSVDFAIFAIGRVPQLDYCSERLKQEIPKLEREGLLYLIGDVRRGIYRQVAIAVGDGIEAAMRISERLRIRRGCPE